MPAASLWSAAADRNGAIRRFSIARARPFDPFESGLKGGVPGEEERGDALPSRISQ